MFFWSLATSPVGAKVFWGLEKRSQPEKRNTPPTSIAATSRRETVILRTLPHPA